MDLGILARLSPSSPVLSCSLYQSVPMCFGPSLEEKGSSRGDGGPGVNLTLMPWVSLGFKAAWVVLLSGPVGGIFPLGLLAYEG